MTISDTPASSKVKAIYEAGLSPHSLDERISSDDLLALSVLCLTGNRIVHTIEAFEVIGSDHYADYRFSLLGQAPEEARRPWPERVRDSHSIVADLVEQAKKAEHQIVYQVWLDEAQEPKNT